MALGATRADIARLWLAESLVATAVATAVGLLLAVWLRDALFVLRPLAGFENFAPSLDLGWRVWGFAAALMAAATGLAGVLPALRAARIDPAQPLREGAAANIGGGRGGWMRAALVSAQAGVAVALVVVAGLLGRSLAAAGRADLGFDPARPGDRPRQRQRARARRRAELRLPRRHDGRACARCPASRRRRRPRWCRSAPTTSAAG